MSENEKDRLTLRVEPEVREEIERHLERGGSRSMNQFLNEAVRHYLDYLDMKRVGSLLPREIMAAIDGRLGDFERNMSRALFKVSAEVDMTNALVADLRQLSQDELDDLRASSVKNVRALNGMTSLDKYMRDREYREAGAGEWLD